MEARGINNSICRVSLIKDSGDRATVCSLPYLGMPHSEKLVLVVETIKKKDEII